MANAHDLKNNILSLEKISQRLEPTKEQRDQLLDDIHSYAGAFIDALEDLPTYSAEQEKAGVFEINGKLKSMAEILSLFDSEVVKKGIKPASGGHIGYIPGGGIYTTALADYLTDVTNVYTGIQYASPGGVAVEHAVLNWLKKMFSFPASAVGNLTSGGSIANLIALTAARDKYAIKSARIPKSVIYLSEQVHHCIQKSLRIIGLEDIIIRYIDLDEKHRMKSKSLEKMIIQDRRSGLFPFLVIASAGTTDTGAIDPLDQIGEIAKKQKLWFHIDAAYGGFFILTSKKAEFKGIEKADSLVVDPHKGLFLPYGLGAVLIKDKEAVYHSNHYFAQYMQDAMDEASSYNPADVSPELTKPFRSMRLWLPLVLHGVEPFVACLEEKILLTRYFRMELKKMGFLLGPEPDLSVSYFWYPRDHGDENAFNRELMSLMHQDGEIFFSSTTLNGLFVIRMAILSFRTKLSTIDKGIEMIKRCLDKIL